MSCRAAIEARPGRVRCERVVAARRVAQRGDHLGRGAGRHERLELRDGGPVGVGQRGRSGQPPVEGATAGDALAVELLQDGDRGLAEGEVGGGRERLAAPPT
jgi:hypothetical protein